MWRIATGILLIKTFSVRKLINFLINQSSYLVSYISGKIIVWGKPYVLSIEPTNYCNLSCPECISGKKAFTRSLGYIDFELYKKVIGEVKSHVVYLMLNFQGESFLHPELIKMIEYAHARNIFVSISTNGHFINKQGFDAIIDSGLSELIISLDGTSQDVYEQYRIGGNFEKVTDTIKGLVKVKKEKKGATPVIKLQFLVFSFNEHQMQAAKELARNLKVDTLVFKSAQLYDLNNTENRTLPVKNKKYIRYRIDKKRGSLIPIKKKSKLCSRLWSVSVITHDGCVVPCCYDKDAEFDMGNLHTESFENIWDNLKYQSFRNIVIKTEDHPSLCRNCNG